MVLLAGCSSNPSEVAWQACTQGIRAQLQDHGVVEIGYEIPVKMDPAPGGFTERGEVHKDGVAQWTFECAADPEGTITEIRVRPLP